MSFAFRCRNICLKNFLATAWMLVCCYQQSSGFFLKKLSSSLKLFSTEKDLSLFSGHILSTKRWSSSKLNMLYIHFYFHVIKAAPQLGGKVVRRKRKIFFMQILNRRARAAVR